MTDDPGRVAHWVAFGVGVVMIVLGLANIEVQTVAVVVGLMLVGAVSVTEVQRVVSAMQGRRRNDRDDDGHEPDN